MHFGRLVQEPLSILMATGELSPDNVVRIICAAARALDSVHGELWPSAILVDGETVRIMPNGTAERSRYGQYAAPERVLGQPPSPQSDVFSLGAILYHALAGRPAFQGDSPSAIMLATCSGDAAEVPSHVPPHVATVIRRSLSRNPADRYASPAAMREALEVPEFRDNFPGRRILVADDDAPIRDFYVSVAARIGVVADVVASGRDAISALRSRTYEVALMDLNMPRLSGWEVLDFLRANWQAQPKRLFIVTGFTDQHVSEADRGLVTAVLYKPVASEELRALVTECLRGGAVSIGSILRTTGHRISSAA